MSPTDILSMAHRYLSDGKHLLEAPGLLDTDKLLGKRCKNNG